MAAATVKRYLAEDRFRIRLTDLVGDAVRQTAERINAQKFQPMQEFTHSEFLRRLSIYQVEPQMLQHMIVPLCHWGNSSHETCVVNIVELAADYSTLGTAYFDNWNNLRPLLSKIIVSGTG